MNRAEKAEFIEDVRAAFTEAPLVILTEFKGSTVLQLDEVRRACEGAGGHFRVVKNTLTRIALEGSGKESLTGHFVGNVGVIFAGDDPIGVAKVFRKLVKDNAKLEPKVGFFEGDVLDVKGVDAVADLPSREELLGQLLATLQEAPRQILGVIQGPARDLLYVLNNYASKLDEAGE